MPEYYIPIKVAKYYGISPVEVIDWPKYFINATFNVIQAEHAVQEKQQKRQERESKRKKGRS